VTGPERHLLDHQAPPGLIEGARMRIATSPLGWSHRSFALAVAASLLLGLVGGRYLAGGQDAAVPAVVQANAPSELVTVDAIVRTGQHQAKPVRLVCQAPDAHAVSVAGSWNSWSTQAAPMRSVGDGLFAVELLIPQGRHEYMFVVDGERWVLDPSAPLAADDGFGQRNSVIEI
jgi:hypothetical protein